MILERTPVADPEAVGIAALQFLVTDDDLMMRFLAMSGLQADDLRAAAGEPGFFAGVLDFILAHEPTLMAFASHCRNVAGRGGGGEEGDGLEQPKPLRLQSGLRRQVDAEEAA